MSYIGVSSTELARIKISSEKRPEHCPKSALIFFFVSMAVFIWATSAL